MKKAGKIWGETEEIIRNSSLEFHRIKGYAGMQCSKHKHAYKWNAFYVVSGTLLIRVWKNDYDLVDETILNSGEWCEVKPGDYHQFEVIHDCEAFELYYANFQHDDIVRETVGGQAPGAPTERVVVGPPGVITREQIGS